MLLRVARFDLLILGPGVPATARQSIRGASTRLPLVDLGSEFSTLEAGQASARLLQEVESHLAAHT